jgi:hypothetical protein
LIDSDGHVTGQLETDDSGNGTQQLRRTDATSHYESSHTVDSQGYAQGGTFSATSHASE